MTKTLIDTLLFVFIVFFFSLSLSFSRYCNFNSTKDNLRDRGLKKKVYYHVNKTKADLKTI